MNKADKLRHEGTGHYRFRKGEISEIVAASKAKKLEYTSYWTRRRGQASKTAAASCVHWAPRHWLQIL